MSDLAVPQTSADRIAAGRLRELARFVAREALPIMVVSLCAIELLTVLPLLLGPDGWLTLLGGRIVANGLPHHDTLTAWSHGGAWVDQQWLAQLVFHGAFVTGGVKLTLLLHAALAIGAFAGAVVAARLRGGSPTRVALVAVVCLPTVVFAWPLRAQSLAYPLFVALLWLLVRDVEHPSRRVFLVFPLLALWANLHGSVVLAAALVALRGAVGLVGSRTKRSVARNGLLVAAPALFVFASPYGFDLAGYYHGMLFDPALTKYIVEWQPTSPKPVTAPFFAAAFGAVWLMARSRRLTAFERLVLLLTIGAALASVRSLAWFALAAIVLLPPALEEVWPAWGGAGREGAGAPARARHEMIGTVAAVGALGAAVVLAGIVIARPLTWLQNDWPPAAGMAVAGAAAADPDVRIVSSLQYADWLLFTQPQLAGRIAFDARLELLSTSQIRQISRLANAVGESWTQVGPKERLFVIDRATEGDLDRVLVARPGARTLYLDDHVRVLLTPRAGGRVA